MGYGNRIGGALSGAGTGAAIGTALLPGIGTGIGALLGAGAGLWGGWGADEADESAQRATSAAMGQQRDAQDRNRSALEQLAASLRGQANPFSDPRALAGQYNQIAHAYAGQSAALDQSLAARGMAGQGQDASLRANLEAARANAVTQTQQDNVAHQADWEQNRQNQLMQLQSLAQAGDANSVQQALQLAQNRQQTAQANAQGLSSGLSSLATLAGAMYRPQSTTPTPVADKKTAFQLGGPYAPESFSGPYAPGFTPQSPQTATGSSTGGFAYRPPSLAQGLQGLPGRRRAIGGY